MSKIDPKEIEKRMARISEMFSEMVAHAETVSQTRCPYRDRHDLCTAEFRCRNQKPPAEEGARHTCGHDGRKSKRFAKAPPGGEENRGGRRRIEHHHP